MNTAIAATIRRVDAASKQKETLGWSFQAVKQALENQETHEVS